MFIDEKDQQIVQSYISTFVNVACSNSRAPLTTVLSEWAKEKETLYHKFGDKFIIEKEICYTEGFEDFCGKWDREFYNTDHFVKMKTNICNYFSEHNDSTWKDRRIVRDLFNDYNLYKNSYERGILDGYTWEWTLPNGKKIKLQKGSKVMKAIGKIAEALGYSEVFEEVRLLHSRCLNQKELKGTLSLSIHPMDYMTMSDNDCGWSSCMSWREDGEYKLGTIEMMNSPYIIVGYLKSKEDWAFNSSYSWNNKKWRCLFYVDENMACNIKPYPYDNEFLTQSALRTIAEVMGWDQTVEPFIPFKPSKVGDRTVFFKPHTKAMYNDFSRTNHYIVVNPEAPEEISKEVYYSGATTCIWCGEEIENYEGGESYLTCGYEPDCDSDYEYCDVCGCECEDWYWVGDKRVCFDCYDEHCFYDRAQGDSYFNEDLWGRIILRSKNGRLERELTASRYTAKDFSEIFVHGEDSLKYNEEEEVYYVDIEELSKWRGLNCFGIYNEDRLKDFL